MKVEIEKSGVFYMEAIEIAHLKKYYRKVKAVDDISFEVHEGERFGFLGPNGAGKTTTIRSILGLLQLDGGEIKILGSPIQPLKNVAYRKLIGYLPGELGLPKEKTGRQILKYVAGLYSNEIEWDYIRDLAIRLDLNLDRPVGTLSKGNKQKVGAIAALIKPFPILILDEPTSGLDPLMQLEFFRILKERQRENKCTVFLSSHLLPEVERFCERVAIIRKGKLVEVSSIQDLKEKNLKLISLEFESEQSHNAFEIYVQKFSEIIIQESKETKMDILVPPKIKRQFLHEITGNQFGGEYIRDMDISHTSLENIFLQYYQNAESEVGQL